MMIKGTTLKVIPLAIKEKFYDSGVEKWLTKISKHVEKEYRQGIIGSKWYSLEDFYLAPVKIYCDIFYNGSLKGAYELGRYDAEQALQGTFKFLFKLGTPDFLIVGSSLIFPTYYKGTKMKVVNRKGGHTTARIEKFGKMKKFTEASISGWTERALELSGAKNIKTRFEHKVIKGEHISDFIAYWE